MRETASLIGLDLAVLARLVDQPASHRDHPPVFSGLHVYVCATMPALASSVGSGDGSQSLLLGWQVFTH